MKGQGGIQMLLTAEQEAQQIVSAAKNCKILIHMFNFQKLSQVLLNLGIFKLFRNRMLSAMLLNAPFPLSR